MRQTVFVLGSFFYKVGLMFAVKTWLYNGRVGSLYNCNGRESALIRAMDGSTYLVLKLVPSSLCKKNFFVVKKHNMYLGLLTPSSG